MNFSLSKNEIAELRLQVSYGYFSETFLAALMMKIIIQFHS